MHPRSAVGIPSSSSANGVLAQRQANGSDERHVPARKNAHCPLLVCGVSGGQCGRLALRLTGANQELRDPAGLRQERLVALDGEVLVAAHDTEVGVEQHRGGLVAAPRLAPS